MLFMPPIPYVRKRQLNRWKRDKSALAIKILSTQGINTGDIGYP
jgi:hypothetical protein